MDADRELEEGEIKEVKEPEDTKLKEDEASSVNARSDVKKEGKSSKRPRRNRRRGRKKHDVETSTTTLEAVSDKDKNPSVLNYIPVKNIYETGYSSPFGGLSATFNITNGKKVGGKCMLLENEWGENVHRNCNPRNWLPEISNSGSNLSVKKSKKKGGNDFCRNTVNSKSQNKKCSTKRGESFSAVPFASSLPNSKEQMEHSKSGASRDIHGYSGKSLRDVYKESNIFQSNHKERKLDSKMQSAHVVQQDIEKKRKAKRHKKALRKQRKLMKKNESFRYVQAKLKHNPDYHAQQEKELEILWQQQEEMAYDNYSNVPMEIEDDDLAVNSDAPLPLIEMPVVRPPPPPGDEFQPAHDQASLSMTSSNVAWMPGFVESLDPETHDLSHLASNLKENHAEIQRCQDTEITSVVSQVEDDGDNDEDVWALRAQALKSLACKRAVKAKEQHKNKKTIVLNEINTVADGAIPSPLPSPSAYPIQKHPVDKSNLKRRKHAFVKVPPPKHPPVIITLSKEDFESQSESDSHSSDDFESRFDVSVDNRQAKHKVLARRRKSAGDETLLKELQSCLKRCRIRMKKHSSYIVKDQLAYKKLQSEIAVQKTLFDNQKENVRRLQEELQQAIKQKNATKKSHKQLYEKIKCVKDQLKEKIHVRNITDERILRAKSIISVNRSQHSANGSSNERWRVQISSLIDALRESYQGLIKTEKAQDSPLNRSLHKYSQSSKLDGMEDENSNLSAVSTAETLNLKGESEIKLEKYQNLCKEALSQIENMPLWKADSKKKGIDAMKKKELKSNNSKLESNISEVKKLFSPLKEDPERCPITYTLTDMLQGVGDEKSLQAVKLQSGSDSSTLIQSFESSKNCENKLYQDYQSPLLRFRSYRLHPNFSSHQRFSVDSSTFTNDIQPEMTICHYDLLGTCNDTECLLTHLDEKCRVSSKELIKDLIAYHTHSSDFYQNMDSTAKQRNVAMNVEQFLGQYGASISPFSKKTSLPYHLREYFAKRNIKAADFIALNKRDWFKKEKHQRARRRVDFKVNHYSSNYDIVYFLNQKRRTDTGSCFSDVSQEIRYFSGSYDSLALLKSRIAENPTDVKLWLSLVHQILSFAANGSFKNLPSNVREYALSVLSQGLEENPYSEELWIQYLKLFSMNHSSSEIRELCYQAVMYAANYNVWWTCLSLENSYTAKQEICSEVIKFILEADEAAHVRSHYLTEIVLYATHLLILCSKIKSAIQYLSAALGIGCCESTIEKLHVIDVSGNLNYLDRSLLRLCLISINAFNYLPDCIFNIEDSGPGRVVKKDGFLLDWRNGSIYSSDEEIRTLFKDSLKLPAEKSIAIAKDLFLLFENAVAFELSLGNITGSVDTLRDLLSEFPSLVNGWVLLVLLYFQFFPDDDIKCLCEKAISNCNGNIQLVYLYAHWLLQKNMPNIALEILKRSIKMCYDIKNNDANLFSVTDMYKKLIGISVPSTVLPLEIVETNISQDDMASYSLCYCLLMQGHLESREETSESCIWEAYEYAIHQYNSRENTKRLWMAYLEYKVKCLSRLSVVSSDEFQAFIDVLFQCLTVVSAIGVVKEDNNLYWKDYEFHNKVIAMCMAIIPTYKHSEIYQKLLNYMPDNIQLALRICHYEFDRGGYSQARILCNSLLEVFPNCLPLWNMALKVEMKCENVKEVRWLYLEATKALPFCASLWRNLAKFEVSHAVDIEKLKLILEDITKNAMEYGVDLRELLPRVN